MQILKETVVGFPGRARIRLGIDYLLLHRRSMLSLTVLTRGLSTFLGSSRLHIYHLQKICQTVWIHSLSIFLRLREINLLITLFVSARVRSRCTVTRVAKYDKTYDGFDRHSRMRVERLMIIQCITLVTMETVKHAHCTLQNNYINNYFFLHRLKYAQMNVDLFFAHFI